MVTDEMVEKAADEMARQDITFANCDRKWQLRTIRRALEAALSAAEPQPAPSVAVKASKTECKNCGGNLNSWFTSNRVNSLAVDGRLKSNEISCDFVLGCDECSETLRVVPAGEIANHMNTALSGQVQDSEELNEEMSLVVALDFADNPRPYHSLQAPADTNGELYRALKAVAAAYRSAQVQNVAGWQPIETAPKDGTEIDLWCRRYTGKPLRLADMWWTESTGWRNGGRDKFVEAIAKNATHWRHVPAAPAKQEGGHD